MRGAHHVILCQRLSAGIIPAYAGSTLTPYMDSVKTEDHPRVCGEHGNWLEPQLRREGSSPRMRGAR